MTVEEIIEELQKFPLRRQVTVPSRDHSFRVVRHVELDKVDDVEIVVIR